MLRRVARYHDHLSYSSAIPFAPPDGFRSLSKVLLCGYHNPSKPYALFDYAGFYLLNLETLSDLVVYLQENPLYP